MLFAQFYLDGDRYLIEAKRILEVLPLVRLKMIAHAPAYVACLLNYRGEVVPVIDLCTLALGRRCKDRLSTRILLYHHRHAGEAAHMLGLLVEGMTEMVHRNAADFGPADVSVAESPYLGQVLTDPAGVMQKIDLDLLLPAEVQEILFISKSQEQKS